MGYLRFRSMRKIARSGRSGGDVSRCGGPGVDGGLVHDGMDTLRTHPPLPTKSRITMDHLAVRGTLQPGCKRPGFFVMKPAVFHPNPRLGCRVETNTSQRHSNQRLAKRVMLFDSVPGHLLFNTL